MIFMDQKYYISLIPARGKQRSEIRDQKTGSRDQESGIRDQKTGIRE